MRRYLIIKLVLWRRINGFQCTAFLNSMLVAFNKEASLSGHTSLRNVFAHRVVSPVDHVFTPPCSRIYMLASSRPAKSSQFNTIIAFTKLLSIVACVPS